MKPPLHLLVVILILCFVIGILIRRIDSMNHNRYRHVEVDIVLDSRTGKMFRVPIENHAPADYANR
jgi:hypothetical protein